MVQRAKQVPTRFSLCPGYAMSAADITCDGLRRCGSLLRIRGGMNFIDAGDEDNDFSLGEEGIEGSLLSIVRHVHYAAYGANLDYADTSWRC